MGKTIRKLPVWLTERRNSSLRGTRRRHTLRLIFVFDSIGYNFEPSELSAAYGVVQLEKLDEFNGQRHANWQKLNDFMANREGVTAGQTQAETDTTVSYTHLTLPTRLLV